jgi:hypothetical protein
MKEKTVGPASEIPNFDLLFPQSFWRSFVIFGIGLLTYYISCNEDKIVPVYDVKVCGGCRRRTPLILNLGARWT